MNKNDLTSLMSKIDRRHVQLAVIIVTLSMLVLSAGAPGAFGDFTNKIILLGH